MKNYIFLIVLVFISCQSSEKQKDSKTSNPSFDAPPEWAKEAIWYQIFAERFRNGDPQNDPSPDDIRGAYPGFVPEKWAITPWTQDWYAPDPYFDQVQGKKDMAGYPIENFGQLSRLRRYGGDLQGVINKIDYLDSLGITAIYFNPLNAAPSEHKYDAMSWRHIDPNFGPSPKKDRDIMAQEIPDDPATWQMTGADQMFVELVQQLHQRGIRVILDYSWNHTGTEFWAWQDLLKHQSQSKYKDWYWVQNFDDPKTPENEFEYRGWFGVKDLPEIKETQYQTHETAVELFEGNIYSGEVKAHIFNIVEKWLDPNGDGNLTDGIDGFRLDVAAEIPLGFWRDFRKKVRSINPNAYLLGEIWWEQYPDKLMDPSRVLEGDIFDGVMNYRWYRISRRFFGKAPKPIDPTAFVDSLKFLASNLRKSSTYAMMNLAGSHDTPRIATSLFNQELKYKYRAEPSNNNTYKIHKPDTQTRIHQKLLLAHQFTFVGAPHIWAGDEMGMWGADMGDTRKPLIWDDYDFQNELVHPLNIPKPEDPVKFDQDLFQYYRTLIQIRKKYKVLMDGDLDFIHVDDLNNSLAYSRFDTHHEVLVVFNLAKTPQKIQLPLKFETEYSTVLGGKISTHTSESIGVELAPESFSILTSQR